MSSTKFPTDNRMCETCFPTKHDVTAPGNAEVGHGILVVHGDDQIRQTTPDLRSEGEAKENDSTWGGPLAWVALVAAHHQTRTKANSTHEGQFADGNNHDCITVLEKVGGDVAVIEGRLHAVNEILERVRSLAHLI